MTDLNDRILRAVASCRVQGDIPAEVLKAIERTYVLVELGRWERIIGAAEAAVNEWGAESRVGLLETDLDPIRQLAAESDTPETIAER